MNAGRALVNGHNSTHLPAVSTAAAAKGAFAAVAVVSAVSPVIGARRDARLRNFSVFLSNFMEAGVHGAFLAFTAQIL